MNFRNVNFRNEIIWNIKYISAEVSNGSVFTEATVIGLVALLLVIFIQFS